MIGLSNSDNDALRHSLEAIVEHLTGRSEGIISIRWREPQHLVKFSYGSQILTVQLSSGDEITIFLKDFAVSQQPKDAIEQRRNRELLLYRDLFAGANLGTAEYYGSVWSEPQGPFWLLLEFVSGRHVQYCDFQYWVAAAAWLGRMQGYFAQRTGGLDQHSLLLSYDAIFFQAKAESACRAVSEVSAQLAERLEQIIKGYGPLVELMATQTGTLVHGEYLASEILVTTEAGPVRICPLDWEKAGLGPTLYDLAFFADGFTGRALDTICDAYEAEATSAGIAVPGREQMLHVMECFRLHLIMHWLSGSRIYNYRAHGVAKLVAMAEKLSRRLL